MYSGYIVPGYKVPEDTEQILKEGSKTIVNDINPQEKQETPSQLDSQEESDTLAGTISRILIYQDKYKRSAFTVLDLKAKATVKGVIGKYQTEDAKMIGYLNKHEIQVKYITF